MSDEQAAIEAKFNISLVDDLSGAISIGWPSPISKADLLSLERVRDYAGAAAITMVPFGFRRIVERIIDGKPITVQDAVGFLLSNLGHPMYNNPKKPNYPGYIKLRNEIFNNQEEYLWLEQAQENLVQQRVTIQVT